jgi:hypothetical protein
MAKLPQAVNVIGGVSPQQMPTVRAPVDAFGADMGKAVSQLGSFIEDEAQKQSRLDNQAEAQELSNELNTRLRNLELGDGDKQIGYKTLSGRDAMDQRQTYEEQAEKIRKELVGRATNPIVRQNFSGVAANRTGQFLTSVGGHFNAQRKAYRKTALDNTTNVATDDAVNATDDATRLAGANDAYTATFNYHSDDLGRPDAVAKTFAEEARSKVHRAVILGLVNNQPTAAREYYEANKGQVDPGDRPALEKVLRGGYVKEESARLVADLANQQGQDTLAKQIAWVKTKTTDVEVVDAATQRLKEAFAVAETDRKVKLRETKEDMWTKINNGTYTSFDQIPTDVIAQLDGTTVNTVKNAFVSIAKGGRGFALADDVDTMRLLHEASVNPDPQVMADIDLNDLRGKLTESRWLYWQGRQRAVASREAKELRRQQSYTLADRLAKEALTAANIDYGKQASTKNAERAQNILNIAREVVENAAEEGRAATREEIQRELSAALLRVDYTDLSIIARGTDFRFERDADREYDIEDYGDPRVQRMISESLDLPQDQVVRFINSIVKQKKRVTLRNIEEAYFNAVNAVAPGP